jgi:transcription elongation factor GreA
MEVVCREAWSARVRHPPEATVASTPYSDRPYLTEEGRRLLEERIGDRERVLEELRAAVHEPGRSADTVESYHRAAREIDHLRSLLEAAGTVEDVPDDPTIVELGDIVTIRLDDGAEETYIVVHPAEAPVEDERISSESPLGRALLGRRVGGTVEVDVPTGSYRCTITRATRREADAGTNDV